MKTKIIGILVVTLLIATTLPAVGNMKDNSPPTVLPVTGTLNYNKCKNIR